MPRRAIAAMIAGALSGVAGALVFATLHAFIIVPIWDRMTSGLVVGALAGVAAGAAFSEFFPESVSTSSVRSILQGAMFGALLWVIVAPVSIADAILRYAGIAPRMELVAVGVAVVLAVGAGAILGWVRTHNRQGSIVGAAATMLLVIAMAGPVPIGRGGRALGIFIAVLPAAIIGGAAVAALAPVILRLSLRSKSQE